MATNGHAPRWMADFMAHMKRMSLSGKPDIKTASELAVVSRAYVTRYRMRNRLFDLELSRVIIQGQLVELNQRIREEQRRAAEAAENLN